VNLEKVGTIELDGNVAAIYNLKVQMQACDGVIESIVVSLSVWSRDRVYAVRNPPRDLFRSRDDVFTAIIQNQNQVDSKSQPEFCVMWECLFFYSTVISISTPLACRVILSINVKLPSWPLL
jgi:hypothetical protein